MEVAAKLGELEVWVHRKTKPKSIPTKRNIWEFDGESKKFNEKTLKGQAKSHGAS
jgi:hypothetical protein